MKKTLLILQLLLFSAIAAHSQIAYYDAQALKAHVALSDDGKRLIFKALNNADKDAIVGIILKYYPQITQPINFQSLGKALSDTAKNRNPFLGPMFTNTLNSGNMVSKAGGIINTIGNVNVGSAAGVAADFLIKRAKQEALISIIEKLRDSTRFPEFTVLFPRTLAVMNNFDSWQYANALNTVKEAFDKDLQQMLGDLPKLAYLSDKDKKWKPAAAIRVQAIQKFLVTEEGRYLCAALLLGNGFVTGQKIPDIINSIAADEYLGNIPKKPDVSNTIKLLNVLSYSIRNNTAGKNYVALSDLKSIVQDSVLRRLYLGLVYAGLENNKVTFGTTNMGTFLAGHYDGALAYIQNMAAQSDTLQTAMDALRSAKKKGEKDLSAYWAAIFESGNELIKSTASVDLLDPSFKLPDEVKHVLDLSTNTLTIAQDIAQRNYNAAIVGVNSMIPSSKDTNTFRMFLIKYGSFAANLVAAKNPGDAEAAIEAVALPVGSYSIKQHSAFNISLNGYLGYGWDFRAGSSNGIYAPIGFSFNWGLSSKRNCGAITAFVSLLDIGSMVSYHLNQDSLATRKQDIRLESIVSPSLQLFYSVPNFPISLGAGVRRTPKLFYSTNAGFYAAQPRNVFNIAILFDIPVITIHNIAFR